MSDIFECCKKIGKLPILKEIMECGGVSPNVTNKKGYTPLHKAAQNGHLDIVKYLVQKDADIDIKDYYLTTPIFLAAERGHLEIVKYLIECGANPNVETARGNSINRACVWNQLEVVKYLYENVPNIEYKNDMASIACSKGYIDLMNYLINNGFKISEFVIYNLCIGGCLEMIEYLIDNGTIKDISDNIDKDELICQAYMGGNLQIVKILHEKFNIELLQSPSNYNPIRSLCLGSNIEVIDYIEKRMSVNLYIKEFINNTDGYTPLHYGCEIGNIKFIERFTLPELINKKNYYNDTPLNIAYNDENFEVVKFLIEKGAEIDMIDFENYVDEIYDYIYQHSNIYKYEKNFKNSENKYNIDHCAICHGVFFDKDNIYELECKHIFHKDCSFKWLCEFKQCPYCVKKISL